MSFSRELDKLSGNEKFMFKRSVFSSEFFELFISCIRLDLCTGFFGVKTGFTVLSKLFAPVRQMRTVKSFSSQQGSDFTSTRATIGLGQDGEFLLSRKLTSLATVILRSGNHLGFRFNHRFFGIFSVSNHRLPYIQYKAPSGSPLIDTEGPREKYTMWTELIMWMSVCTATLGLGALGVGAAFLLAGVLFVFNRRAWGWIAIAVGISIPVILTWLFGP